MTGFEPHRWLRNRHLMTLAGALLPRHTPGLPPADDRLFEVEPGTQLLARCHWQREPRRSPTLALVHGLEGSSESGYIRTLAAQAFTAGFNVLRINQRNCGGTERLTATLYNSGLSADFRAVLLELIERDRLKRIFFAGYSMGGNLILKMAGELGAAAPRELRGICAVCPTLDLAACVDAIERPENWLYQFRFVRDLKSRMRRKAKLFPGQFELNGLSRVRTLREFDDAITAPCSGYRSAAGLLRAGKRDARGAPDCRANAHSHIEGRSGGSLRVFWRFRNCRQSPDSSCGHGIWRTLRFYIADERTRTLLGGGASAGILHCACAGINFAGTNKLQNRPDRHRAGELSGSTNSYRENK